VQPIQSEKPPWNQPLNVRSSDGYATFTAALIRPRRVRSVKKNPDIHGFRADIHIWRFAVHGFRAAIHIWRFAIHGWMGAVHDCAALTSISEFLPFTRELEPLMAEASDIGVTISAMHL
jgi:hypothetical protein